MKAGQVSDPFLMTGFDKKVVHLATEDAGNDVDFTIEVDFLCDGIWRKYETIRVPANGYIHHEFADGFSAHRVRVKADKACVATVWITRGRASQELHSIA